MNRKILANKLERTRLKVATFPLLNQLATIFATKTSEAFRALLNAPIEIPDWRVEIRRCGEYLDSIPAPATIAVAKFAETDGLAALHFNADLAYHVVDMSMGGDPLGARPVTERAPTATDLALCKRAARSALIAFERTIPRLCDGESLGAIECDRFETLPKMVKMAADRSETVVITLNLQLGRGGRSGALTLALPFAVLDPIKDKLRSNFSATATINSTIWEDALKRSALQCELPMSAVIERSELPLSRLLSLKSGDVLPLSATNVDDITLTLETHSGVRPVAQCGLGTLRTSKAVRLKDAPDPDLTTRLKELLL